MRKLAFLALGVIIIFIAGLAIAVSHLNFFASESEPSPKMCRQIISGTIDIHAPVSEGQTIISLEYHADGQLREQAATVTGKKYTITAPGSPTAKEPWTISGYYYDKKGEISETSQQLDGVSCNQKITVDMSL